MTNILRDLILGLVTVCCNFDPLGFRESDSEHDGYCLEFLGLEIQQVFKRNYRFTKGGDQRNFLAD